MTILLLFILLFNTTISDIDFIMADKEEETKLYIVRGNNTNAYSRIKEEVDKNTRNESSILEEKNILTAELTEEDAEELNQKSGIIVEEDIKLEANQGEVTELIGTEPDEIKLKMMQERNKIPDISAILKKAKTHALEHREWNMKAIDADDVNQSNNKNKIKVKIAILDSGVDYTPGVEIKSKINFVEEEMSFNPMFQDMTGHGTGIAGIIISQGEMGVRGINPNAELYSIKVLDRENTSTISRIVKGIYWCIDHDINIINMSFGTHIYSEILEKAVKDANEAGILMIGAAGNDDAAVEYPAAFEEVMAVASSDTGSEISDFSNTGKELEVAAPGEYIKTAGQFGGCVVTSGTSIAAAHVTGAASLVWQKNLKKSPQFIRRLIEDSTKEMKDSRQCGLLDAQYALKHYKEFSKEYKQHPDSENSFLENQAPVQSFKEIETQEGYVEARWNKEGHQSLVDWSASLVSGGTNGVQFKILKDAIIYPDVNSKTTHKNFQQAPEWHGYYDYRDNTKEMLNYIAGYELLTRLAQKNGDWNGLYYDDVMGLSVRLYNKYYITVGKSIGFGGVSWGTLLNQYSGGNSNANRRYFIWGCALHLASDIFAHFTYRNDGTMIDNANGADNPNEYPTRHKAAFAAVWYGIWSLNNNTYSDYYDFILSLQYAKGVNSNDLSTWDKARLYTYANLNAPFLTKDEETLLKNNSRLDSTSYK